MDADLTMSWIRLVATRVADRRAWLTELDAAIGDGDHGINLDRGFAAVVAQLDAAELPAEAVGPLIVATGRTIMGSVGGASGALYGQAFLRAGSRLATSSSDGSRVSPADLVCALEAAVAGIASLGRAQPGEKTMLDALVPALAALRDAVRAGVDLGEALDRAARAADAGALATIPMLATKGRASYLGERSIGHLDPGAASSALLIRALADTVGRGARAVPGTRFDDDLTFCRRFAR